MKLTATPLLPLGSITDDREDVSNTALTPLPEVRSTSTALIPVRLCSAFAMLFTAMNFEKFEFFVDTNESFDGEATMPQTLKSVEAAFPAPRSYAKVYTCHLPAPSEVGTKSYSKFPFSSVYTKRTVSACQNIVICFPSTTPIRGNLSFGSKQKSITILSFFTGVPSLYL